MRDRLDKLFAPWNLEEQLYRQYTECKKDPAALAAFRDSLDMKLIQQRYIVLPGITDAFFPQLTMIPDFFTENVRMQKHDRYNFPFTHWHTFLELAYVYEGDCEQVVEGKSYHLKQGEFAIILPNQKHSIYTQGIVVNVLIKKKFILDNFLSNLSEKDSLSRYLFYSLYTGASAQTDNLIRVDLREEKELLDLLHLLLWEGFREEGGDDGVKAHLLLAFLAQVSRNCLPSLPEQEGYEEQFVSDVMQSVTSHYPTITLQDLADQLHYSVPYLSKRIRQEFHMTFRELLFHVRSDQACRLLERTDLSIEQIALAVGYESQVGFYRAFKRNLDMTPDRYRQNLKANRVSFVDD